MSGQQITTGNQIRIFLGAVSEVQRTINQWFAANPAVILGGVDTAALEDGRLVVTIWFTGLASA
jgi:hypothetical protein